MWRAVLQIATNRILDRDWCRWRWSLTRAAPPHAPSLHARTGASADQSLGAPRCCTACIMSTNAVPEPDRGSAVPQHRPSCLHLLIAAIASWATPYLADAIAALRAEGEDARTIWRLISHPSPGGQ